MMIKNFFNKLICKHDYICKYLYKIDGGMDKLYELNCKKCGKKIYVSGGLLYKHLRRKK